MDLTQSSNVLFTFDYFDNLGGIGVIFLDKGHKFSALSDKSN